MLTKLLTPPVSDTPTVNLIEEVAPACSSRVDDPASENITEGQMEGDTDTEVDDFDW